MRDIQANQGTTRSRRLGGLARIATTVLSLAVGATAWSQGATASQSPGPLPQPTSWKVLLVAAEDREPVFSNAVDALRERLLSYGVAPRDIAVLKVDAGNPAELATPRNLHQRWSGMLGSESTGCFVYMTSHGARDRGLYFRLANDMMPPAYLAAMLDQACGDRPTVVVMSGCYSGIYAHDPAMRRPNRIVMTAARPDRTSFGCHPDETYTVYDNCFLQSMQRGVPWPVVASNVTACVGTTEHRRNFQPASQPQTYVGGSVGTLRTF